MKLFRTLKIILIVILLSQLTLPTAAAPLQPITIPITPLPLDAPELVNPGRGYYAWRGKEIVPTPEPAFDDYERFFWYDPDHPEESLELSPGVYNFAMLDQAIATAEKRGQKFAFRLRTMANKRSGQRFVPDYLAECGWDYRGTFIPDWNSACFLDNAEKMLQALGKRYDKDTRIAWMDIGMYGEWGEWALSDSVYASAPKDIRPPSDATLNRIVDMQVNAFPSVRKVMMAKTRSSAVIHALQRSKQIGWRVDCLGRQGYFNFPTHPDYMPAWKYMKDRWKTAPVIVEFCAGNISLGSQVPINQVTDFHISLIGNGNFKDWERLSKREQDNLTLLGKIAGYRYLIREITVPDVWSPGGVVRLTTEWENVGVAPHYEPSEVVFQLVDPKTSQTVWVGKSVVNLQTLLPTGDLPVGVHDRFTLPAKLAPGAYQLRLLVIDPAEHRAPLKLAIQGRQADGSYLLGSVSVSSPVIVK